MWRSCQSRTSDELRDDWRAYVRGWWGYYRLAEERRNIFGLEGWIRRHIRKCFWQRWHDWRGGCGSCGSWDCEGRLLESGAQFQGSVAHRGQSELADGAEQRGVAALWVSDAIGSCGHHVEGAAFNRRMRKTARPVVWEGAGAQSPAPDPIAPSVVRAKREDSRR